MGRNLRAKVRVLASAEDIIIPVVGAITGLTTKTVYYYRVKGVATVSGESVTVYGIKRSFKTI